MNSVGNLSRQASVKLRISSGVIRFSIWRRLFVFCFVGLCFTDCSSPGFIFDCYLNINGKHIYIYI